MTTPIVAWHGDPDLKAAAVARMREHAAADRLIRGSYIDNSGGEWRGCLHGCLTAEALAAEQGVAQPPKATPGPGGWHAESERLWGIPRDLGVLLDRAYERSERPAGELAVDILEAIPVGVDLRQVVDHLMLDLLHDPDHGVWLHTQAASDAREAVDQVAGLFRRRLAGDEPARGEWAAAGRAAAWATTTLAALAAGRAAAGAAARAAARDAAWAVAWGAADAADAAAWATANGAADAAAWAAWWEQRILHHLRTAEVTR